jgi:dTDP-4-dehydrorhamnose reductase
MTPVPRFLVLGATGQLGFELQRQAAPTAAVEAIDRTCLDVTDEAGVQRVIAASRAAVVINATAYTAVDRAETETAAADAVNARAPAMIAAACASRGLPLVHVSTDYVFDGEGTRPWTEADEPAPRTAYGRSKLAGEIAIRKVSPAHVIVRTAWVFGAHGGNFVKTMLRVGATRKTLGIVADQHGCPTPAAALADALLAIAARCHAGLATYGTFHFAGTPATTWADFAETIFARAFPPENRPVVERIATEDYPTPASRPRNSVLDCQKLQAVYGIAQPDWRDALATVLSELRS